jgi:peptide chain release factor 2
MAKDHRTDLEIGNVKGVLEGELQPFIDAYLKFKRAAKKAVGKPDGEGAKG